MQGTFASELLAYSSYGVPWIVRTYLNSTQRGTVGLMNFFLGVTCMHDISLFFKGDNFSFSSPPAIEKPTNRSASQFLLLDPNDRKGAQKWRLWGRVVMTLVKGCERISRVLDGVSFLFWALFVGFLASLLVCAQRQEGEEKRQSPIENTLKPPAKKAQSCLFGR